KASALLHHGPVPQELATRFSAASTGSGSLGFLGAAGSTQAELEWFTVRVFLVVFLVDNHSRRP
ncbi:hypothetical protein DQ353_09800, partial [Arthrobacter sp. AQ5-05]